MTASLNLRFILVSALLAVAILATGVSPTKCSEPIAPCFFSKSIDQLGCKIELPSVSGRGNGSELDRSSLLKVCPQPVSWSVRKIGADSVWTTGVRGTGIVVALLDTGVRYTHVDLADHLWINQDEIPDNGIDDDSNGYVDDYFGYDFWNGDGDPVDDNGHGTFVAGLISGNGTAGLCVGVAPDAMVMSLKVVDSLGKATETHILEAIQYAVENGADVICCTIGWPDVENPNRNAWRDICTAVANAGKVIVANAGNGIGEIPHRVPMPATIPPPWLNPDQTLRGEPSGVIAVSATDSMDIYYGQQIGPTEWFDYPYVPGDPDSIGLLKPDLAAPGLALISLDFASDTTYVGPWSSAAFGTPHVAGAVALLRSADPSLTPAEIDSLLETTAVDLGPAGKDNFYGAGRIDVWAAYHPESPGVEEIGDRSGPQPRRPILLHNRPNPFQGSTTVSYSLPSVCHVSLQVYDLTGRLVETLVGRRQNSGIHRVRWSPGDKSTGVYFCRMKAEDFVSTLKMMVLR